MFWLLPDPDPVVNILTGHQGLQEVPAHVIWRPLIDLLRNSFQQANGNISIKKKNSSSYLRINMFKNTPTNVNLPSHA